MAGNLKDADKEAKLDRERHLDEIKKALAGYNEKKLSTPDNEGGELARNTRSYKIFSEEEAVRFEQKNMYDWLCKFFEDKFDIPISQKTENRLKRDIEFAGIAATPKGVVNLAIFSGVVITLISMIIFIAPISEKILPNGIRAMILCIGLIVGYLIYNNPSHRAVITRIESGGELVMGVLYIIVFLKNRPNLEGAIRFAADNTSGKFSEDLKKILWDLENGKTTNIDDALADYVVEWKDYNRPFVDSIELIRSSMNEGNPIRRENLLDKAMQFILQGTDDRMKHYARGLKTPNTIIQGLGILLPVMGMIIFPLVATFMGDSMPNLAAYLLIGYDIILPIMVFFLMKRIMDTRPATKSYIDISDHPDTIPIQYYKAGKSKVLVWPFAILAGGLVMVLGYIIKMAFGSMEEPIFLLSSPVFHSMFIIWGIAAGFIVYNYYTSVQKMDIMKNLGIIEDEFESALFSLGNRLSGGTPLELALIKASEDTKELEISGLYNICAKNMNRLNMTFQQSLFDPEYGAMQYYPSKIIKTIMKSLSETFSKGTKAAATTMLVISEYMRQIRTTQEKIIDLLSESVSSMKFQAFVLLPTISGVVVATAQIIMTMMLRIGESMSSLAESGDGAVLGGANPLGAILPTESAVAPWFLQMVVGIYVIEVLILLGKFITRINSCHPRFITLPLQWLWIMDSALAAMVKSMILL